MHIQANTVSEIGAAIRARRRELGWDQATLARNIGASRLWVNQIEGGKPGASLGLVLRAIAALGLSLTLATPDATAHKNDDHAPVRSPDINAVLNAARRKTSS